MRNCESIVVEQTDAHPLTRPMHAERELLWFVLVSALDIFATYILLRHGEQFSESNPIALFFLDRWGIKGMIYFKLGMVAFICTVSHVIAMKRPAWAQKILQFAIVVVSAVVVYSVMLLLRHGHFVS